MDLQLNDKVALVTAASKGLGKAAAYELAKEGAKVAMCARSQQLETTASEIWAKTRAEILPVRADVTKQDQVEHLVKATMQKFGRIDILIINAGGPKPGGFLDLEVNDWETAIQLTLMSAVRLSYAVTPHMLAQGEGSIVTTQSVSVKQPIDNLVLSNSLRMGVVGLMKTMANELGPKGIRVNSINPTYTWTDRVEQLMTDRANRSGRSIEEETEMLTGTIPLRRMGTVEEFGRAIAWLASPAASYIHGHALMFDGGATRASL